MAPRGPCDSGEGGQGGSEDKRPFMGYSGLHPESAGSYHEKPIINRWQDKRFPKGHALAKAGPSAPHVH